MYIMCIPTKTPTPITQAVAIKCFYSEDADVIGEIQLMERVSGKPHVLPLEGVYLSNDTGEEAQVWTCVVVCVCGCACVYGFCWSARACWGWGGA